MSILLAAKNATEQSLRVMITWTARLYNDLKHNCQGRMHSFAHKWSKNRQKTSASFASQRTNIKHQRLKRATSATQTSEHIATTPQQILFEATDGYLTSIDGQTESELHNNEVVCSASDVWISRDKCDSGTKQTQEQQRRCMIKKELPFARKC
jgi:hypothetical protein